MKTLSGPSQESSQGTRCFDTPDERAQKIGLGDSYV